MLFRSQKVNSEIGCELLELFFDPAFSVIEILAGTFIESHEVARADRFFDEMYVNNLRRVKNFSTSQDRLGMARDVGDGHADHGIRANGLGEVATS